MRVRAKEGTAGGGLSFRQVKQRDLADEAREQRTENDRLARVADRGRKEDLALRDGRQRDILRAGRDVVADEQALTVANQHTCWAKGSEGSTHPRSTDDVSHQAARQARPCRRRP